jgi:hypothetical protein
MRIPHWIESKWSLPTKVPAMVDLFCSCSLPEDLQPVRRVGGEVAVELTIEHNLRANAWLKVNRYPHKKWGQRTGRPQRF